MIFCLLTYLLLMGVPRTKKRSLLPSLLRTLVIQVAAGCLDTSCLVLEGDNSVAVSGVPWWQMSLHRSLSGRNLRLCALVPVPTITL